MFFWRASCMKPLGPASLVHKAQWWLWRGATDWGVASHVLTCRLGCRDSRQSVGWPESLASPVQMWGGNLKGTGWDGALHIDPSSGDLMSDDMMTVQATWWDQSPTFTFCGVKKKIGERETLGQDQIFQFKENISFCRCGMAGLLLS